MLAGIFGLYVVEGIYVIFYQKKRDAKKKADA
jgi:hypothetical protein